MKYWLIFIVMLVVFVVAVTLGAQNDQMVSFHYLIAQGEYRLSTLLAVLFTLGLILGWLVCGLFYLRLRMRLLSSERQLKKATLELTKLNASPQSVTPAEPRE